MRLLARLFTHLMGLLPTAWPAPGAASWYGPQPLPMTRPGKSGVAAVRRAARKARNRRRARRA